MKLFKRRSDEGRDDEWAVATTTFEDAPMIIRVNTSCSDLMGAMPIQIGVAVPLNEPVPGGLPTATEDHQLGGIEEKLLSTVGDRAVLVGVLTTGTMREFVLYAASGDWVEAFHGELGAAVPTHDVQVVAKADPDWSVYNSLAED
jgi:hypothetical protein